jgi:hypothetical protein
LSYLGVVCSWIQRRLSQCNAGPVDCWVGDEESVCVCCWEFSGGRFINDSDFCDSRLVLHEHERVGVF